MSNRTASTINDCEVEDMMYRMTVGLGDDDVYEVGGWFVTLQAVELVLYS
jgi:hypothetical protein